MGQIFRRLAIPLAILILILFALFVVNQTVQVFQLAQAVHPLLGQVVLWALLAVYAVLLLVPLVYYFRMPRNMRPADPADEKAYNRYLKQLAARLSRHPRLGGRLVSTKEQIKKAIGELDKQTTEVIKANATTVFLTTAISQSGRLDAFTVLLAQIRMVWQVAGIYYQRPSLRELLQLYANVAATAFIAGELEDIDISQQVEPIISSVVGGSISGAIPGVHTVANIITNSLLTGAANAYLTLRVGTIAKRYCGSLIKSERRLIRRSATVEAAKMLSVIVMSSAGKISKSMINAAIKRPGKFSRDVVMNTWNKLSGFGKKQVEVD